MQRLLPELWVQFVKPAGPFDGRRFEALVERLLNRRFGGGWRITKISWDGGRDFVQPTPTDVPHQGERWAECKLHRQPVALRLISNTLVMAVVERPRQVMFFSYSPVIENAQEHLARFAAATSIRIEVIDDELLEELILEHWGDVGRFFPEKPRPVAARDVDPIEARTRVTRDFDVDPSRWDDQPAPPSPADAIVSVRSVLRLQLFIRHRRLDSETPVTIEVLGADAPGDAFELVNVDSRSVTLVLEPAGVTLHEAYVRSVTAGQHLVLPSFALTTTAGCRQIESGSVSVRPVFLPPLIGGRFREAIETFKEATSLRSRPVFASVVGASGTGKTKLKSEFATVLLSRGYEIHSFDASGHFWGGFRLFVRRLLAALHRIPVLPAEPTSPVPDDPAVGQMTVDELLSNHGRDPAEHLDAVVDLVRSAISGRPIAIVFDNVQYLDASTLTFLERLISDQRLAASRLVCVLVFNTDALPLNRRAAALLDQLDQTQALLPEQFIIFELRDLSDGEVDLFLDQMIAGPEANLATAFSTTYPLLAALFRRRVVPRPLNVIQTIFYLADVGAIGRNSSLFTVADAEALQTTLAETPRALSSMLERRWQEVMKLYPGLRWPVTVLSHLNRVKTADADSLNVDPESRDLLVRLGLAIEADSGELHFFHEQIGRWFIERLAALPADDAMRLCHCLESSNLTDRYFPGYFVAATSAARLNPALVARATTIADSGLSADPQSAVFGQALLDALRTTPHSVPPEEEIETARALALCVSAEKGIARRLSVLAREVEFRKSAIQRYAPAGKAFVWLVAEHASWHFGTQDDSTALRLLEDGLSLVDQLDFGTSRDRELSQAYLLNRLCVAHKSLGRARDAIVAGSESLATAQRWNDIDLMFFGHVDLGYVYYDSVPASQLLLDHWRAALAHHESSPRDTRRFPDRSACAALIRSKVLLIERRFAEAANEIDGGMILCAKTLDVYYWPKFVLLQILLKLLSPAPQRHVLFLGTLRTERATCA